MSTTTEVVDGLLKKHNVEMASVCVMHGNGNFERITRGGAPKYNEYSKLQIASLSKTIGTAFAMEFFKSKGIPMTSEVNEILAKYTKSSWRARVNPSLAADRRTASWPKKLILEHLVSHCGGLGLHYVNGIPGGAGRPMPSPESLLRGEHEKDFGYPEIVISTEPGTTFAYSGAGFLVLQLILEEMHGQKPVHEIMRDFVAATAGDGGVAFDYPDPKTSPHGSVVQGRREDGSIVDPFLRFPAFAAGGVGTSLGVCKFLDALINAYWSLDGYGPISHSTAIQMLHSVDKGSVKFIGAGMGLGVFVTWAGENGIILHQAANDGFRGVFVACFRGPDVGKGFCVLNNGDNNGTWLNSELLQHLFVHHKWSHVDFSKFRTGVGGKDVPQEEIVNDVLRSCVFEAFEAHLPESLGTASYELGGRDFQSFFAAVDSDGNGAIDFREFLHLSRSVVGIRPSQVSNQQLRRIFYTLDKDASGELSIQEFLDWFNDKSAGEGSDARKVFESVASSAASGLKRCQVFGSGENLMREAAVVECTDQGFARAENLVSPYVPRFDPTLFGRQGKVMDSWESVRHNTREFDAAVFELPIPTSEIGLVVVSTEYHDGNHGEFVGIDVRDSADSEWHILLPKRQLAGHSMHYFAVQSPLENVTHVRVRNYPDGGITRVGLFSKRHHHVHGPDDAVRRCASMIPHVQPSARVNTVWTPSRTVQDLSIARSSINVFSRAAGARIGGCSNERFGPADACISDDPPAGMFDGCETARSRGANHHDWVVIETSDAWEVAEMRFLVVDFTFFRNNNPVDMEFYGWDESSGRWTLLIERFAVKAFAGNTISVPVPQNSDGSGTRFRKFKVAQYPDGGFNRVRLLCKPKRAQSRL